MKRKVAFVLSGSGVKDGTEIHEAVSALIALDRAGYDIIFTAPDIEQTAVVDHCSEKPESETRNALVESARIARGDIKSLTELSPDEYDAVVFPGGFGAALTLCSFAKDGTECSVNPEVRKLIDEALESGKPIAAMCIAPVILARIIPGVRLTIGSHPETADAINSMGAVHVNCPVNDSVVDRERKIVTTPAYMLANGPAEVYEGAVSMVEKLGELF
ncbi:MAG: isoprenoid biosynthesis glyoxalase ElbB [Candidatus Aegiribacteria sp.]|nr:isoprenoid biosynthesis glyoxalase ElbB [Candidatus Aegiribacteria sp.]